MKSNGILAILFLTCASLAANAADDRCWGAVQRAAIAAGNLVTSYGEDCKSDAPDEVADGYDVDVTCESGETHTIHVKTEIRGGQCRVIGALIK